MNRLSQDIPNRIKQPSKCCTYCGKGYVKALNLNKHIILCELLHNSNRSKNQLNDDFDDIPSHRKLYQMLLELGDKYTKLETKVSDLNKWVLNKKKKINVIEWLNANLIPSYGYDELIEKIIITEEDVLDLFKNTFADTLNGIFAKNIYSATVNNIYPIFAFSQKVNIFYMYESNETKWVLLTNECLMRFLNKVHMKLLRAFREHRQLNSEKINTDDSYSILCDKTSIKMMEVDFRQDTILGKIKKNMYSNMKIDITTILEYEFEF